MLLQTPCCTVAASWHRAGRASAALTDAIADPDRAAARRAFEAMMTMTKIDIAAIEAARRVDAAVAPGTP